MYQLISFEFHHCVTNILDLLPMVICIDPDYPSIFNDICTIMCLGILICLTFPIRTVENLDESLCFSTWFSFYYFHTIKITKKSLFEQTLFRTMSGYLLGHCIDQIIHLLEGNHIHCSVSSTVLTTHHNPWPLGL